MICGKLMFLVQSGFFLREKTRSVERHELFSWLSCPGSCAIVRELCKMGKTRCHARKK